LIERSVSDETICLVAPGVCRVVRRLLVVGHAFNIHTAANLNGVARGQLSKS
jgi:hypothetical protein